MLITQYLVLITHYLVLAVRTRWTRTLWSHHHTTLHGRLMTRRCRWTCTMTSTTIITRYQTLRSVTAMRISRQRYGNTNEEMSMTLIHPITIILPNVTAPPTGLWCGTLVMTMWGIGLMFRLTRWTIWRLQKSRYISLSPAHTHTRPDALIAMMCLATYLWRPYSVVPLIASYCCDLHLYNQKMIDAGIKLLATGWCCVRLQSNQHDNHLFIIIVLYSGCIVTILLYHCYIKVITSS